MYKNLIQKKVPVVVSVKDPKDISKSIERTINLLNAGASNVLLMFDNYDVTVMETLRKTYQFITSIARREICNLEYQCGSYYIVDLHFKK